VRGGALALGLVGGVIGLVAAGFALAVGGIGTALNSSATSSGQTNFGMVTTGGWIALGSSVVGLVGAALALAKPRLASLVMLVAAIGGFVGISLFYVVAGPLLLVGALLAFLGRNAKPGGVMADGTVPGTSSPVVSATAARGMRSLDGRYWWDGANWQPIPATLPPEPPRPPT
jgi:hypothetical protein